MNDGMRATVYRRPHNTMCAHLKSPAETGDGFELRKVKVTQAKPSYVQAIVYWCELCIVLHTGKTWTGERWAVST